MTNQTKLEKCQDKDCLMFNKEPSEIYEIKEAVEKGWVPCFCPIHHFEETEEFMKKLKR